jgi:hypothetical protein
MDRTQVNSFEAAVQRATKLWARGTPSQKLISEIARKYAVEHLVAENAFFDAICEYPEQEGEEV